MKTIISKSGSPVKKSKEFFKGKCNLSKCTKKLDNKFFCNKHWRFLTKEIKKDIFKYWYEGDMDSLSFAVGFAKGLLDGKVSSRDYSSS